MTTTNNAFFGTRRHHHHHRDGETNTMPPAPIPEEEEDCVEEEDEDEDEEEEDELDDIEQYVQIRPTSTQNEATCRVTCPDKTGLGADLARTIFDFGLVIVKGDFATDGQWAFLLLTIYAPPSTHELQGGRAKKKKKKKKKKKSKRSRKKRGSTENGHSESKNKSESDDESDDEDGDDDDEDDDDDFDDESNRDAKDNTCNSDSGVNSEVSDDTNAEAEEEEEEKEKEKSVNWKLLQMRMENLCPKKLSITKSGKESNGNGINESDLGRSGSGVGGALQKRGRHSRKSSSRLDEIINANNKNGGKSHLEDMNKGDDGNNGNNNNEDNSSRSHRSQSRNWNQQRSYSDFHDYFDDDDEYYKPSTFILRVELEDRVGLLRDLTLTLWECALIVQRAHISTSPVNTAVDLFYVMDTKDELPNEDRVQEIEAAVRSVVAHGDEVKVGLHQVPIYAQGDYITRAGWLDDFSISKVESASATEYPSCDVWVDNLMSDRHTVFQMISRDRKGLLYDVLRASKELKVQIYYAKVEMKSGGLCEIDLFCERMTNDENARYLCQKYKQNIERPVAVQITSKGIDDLATELRVICPLDFTGVTRPRVLLDATEALRQLRVMVFKADIVIDPGFSEGEQGQHQQEDFVIHRIDSSNEETNNDVNGAGGANLGMLDGGRDGQFSSQQQQQQHLMKTPSPTLLRKSGSSKSVHRTLAREVHRFLLTDERGMPISNVRDRKIVCDAVLKNLLGLRGPNEYFPGMSEVSEGSDFYASSEEYESDGNDGDNMEVGRYGGGRIGRARANSSWRKKNNSNNYNKEGGYIGSAIGFAKRLFFFQNKK